MVYNRMSHQAAIAWHHTCNNWKQSQVNTDYEWCTHSLCLETVQAARYTLQPHIKPYPQLIISHWPVRPEAASHYHSGGTKNSTTAWSGHRQDGLKPQTTRAQPQNNPFCARTVGQRKTGFHGGRCATPDVLLLLTLDNF
eukprot:jgi/Ulvmu1/11004/UM007_0184.1